MKTLSIRSNWESQRGLRTIFRCEERWSRTSSCSLMRWRASIAVSMHMMTAGTGGSRIWSAASTTVLLPSTPASPFWRSRSRPTPTISLTPVAKLEADPFALGASAVAFCLATLEASYTDRDAEFTRCLSHLESLRIGANSVERDDRVKQLEATTADLTSWCPSVDGVLDDVCIAVKKLEKSHDRDVFDALSHGPGLLSTPTKALASSRDRDVFDTMSHGSSLLPTPTKAAVQVSAGLTANPPVMGHHVESTPQDSGSGVDKTWIPVPANGTFAYSTMALVIWSAPSGTGFGGVVAYARLSCYLGTPGVHQTTVSKGVGLGASGFSRWGECQQL
ncbi:uncharacterized protein [Miscanthus floridulus]|uniref:uncharacterized protein isoform X2 n=1 Tax=Miscanthus floridulus TaxID=154761 RepID=UPI0034594F2C